MSVFCMCVFVSFCHNLHSLMEETMFTMLTSYKESRSQPGHHLLLILVLSIYLLVLKERGHTLATMCILDLLGIGATIRTHPEI